MKRPLALIVLIVLASFACNMSGGSTEEPGAPQEPVSPPSSDNTLAPTATDIVHKVIPVGLPSQRSSHAGDYDTSTFAKDKKAAGGDRFTFGRFERPFNANTMDDYFPHLDLVDTLVYVDDTWVYAVMTLQGADADGNLSGTYGVELDLTLDGKADWLVLADHPSSDTWTTDGVRVYQDANHDVGGISAMFTDEKPVTGDGFELEVFNSGGGDDPDSAWVRISPDDPLTVEIAVKRSVLKDDDDRFLINMWAGNEDLNPALFDFNDHFTHEQAGAADKGLEFFYPIKELSELDNSCRMAVGFQALGNEPGLCPLAEPQEACNVPPPPNGCPVLGAFALQWNPDTCQCEVP